MRREKLRAWARRTVGAGLLAAGIAGCSTTQEPAITYLGKASLNYYDDKTTELDYPTGAEGDVTPVLNSSEPRAVGDRRKDEIWDLTLTEALHCSLTNSKVIRSRVRSRGTAGSQGFSSTALTNPNNVPTIYDPAIQESGVLFGGRGVEAALADFDAQLNASMIWGRNAAYQNNAFLSGFGGSFNGGTVGGGTVPATVLTQETGVFQSGISKTFATGGQVNVFHNWNYNANNLPSTTQLFRSSYTGATGIGFTQPLLAGAGVEYTRIAGVASGFSRITGVNQGVLIARINQDITLADFEMNVRSLLKDVEDVYWNLYLAYRQYDVAIVARNSALRSWREAKARLDIGGVQGFRPADEAQAKDRYFETRAQVESALNDIYTSEAELRRLMGLAPNDGRVIRPIEEPTTAKLTPDWTASLADGLMFRTELRRQKWNIKSLQLQLIAARSLTMPQLNLVSNYQVNGFGDNLLASSDDDGVTNEGLNSAYGTLLNGQQTGWNLGLQFSMPFGFRQAKTQVRNIELRLAKAREVLSAQELDVAHEVADALQSVEFQYKNAETNFNRRAAAARRVQLFEQELEAGTVTLDDVLRAQASLATAESAYYTSLVQYNQSLSYLQLVKGTLLERDGVHLEEGTWTPKAYEQALRKAWARSHAFENPFLKDVPPPFAIPEDSRQLICPPDAPAATGTPPAAAVNMPLPPPAPMPSNQTPSTEAETSPALQGGAPPAPPVGDVFSRSAIEQAAPWDEEHFRLPIRVQTLPLTEYKEFAAGETLPATTDPVRTVAHEVAAEPKIPKAPAASQNPFDL
jgi:outer membrane protein TolC